MTTFTNARPKTTPQRGFRASPDRPLALLARCPVHIETPMPELADLAKTLGVAQLFAKNEGKRMRLGSFKALGGAFAVAQMICEAAGVEDPVAAKETAATMTFVTASAGNHGLSVAAGAKIFGARAVIILPSTVPAAFDARIRATGAEVIGGQSYDDSVAQAIRLADENGWIHLSDGSWAGYTARPALILEGYSVLSAECAGHFAALNTWPTHVFLQAGVGGLAAGVAAHIRDHWPVQPNIVVVEPDRAPCLINSMKAGALTMGDGPDSNMGRLDCKNASLIAFEALRADADIFVTITDEAAAQAAATLAAHGLATTPSGAAGLAGLIALAPAADSRCMIVVSEGSENG